MSEQTARPRLQLKSTNEKPNRCYSRNQRTSNQDPRMAKINERTAQDSIRNQNRRMGSQAPKIAKNGEKQRRTHGQKSSKMRARSHAEPMAKIKISERATKPQLPPRSTNRQANYQYRQKLMNEQPKSASISEIRDRTVGPLL